MKINRNSQLGPINPFGGGSPAPEADRVEENKAPSSDQVSLASSTQVRQLGKMVQAMPAVRTEKVNGLRDAIEDGNYWVESDKLAKKVVDETIQELLLNDLQSRK